MIEKGHLYDLDAERALLACLMLNKDAISRAIEIVKPGDFYDDRHRIIYNTILRVYERGEPADPVVLKNELEKEGVLEKIGGLSYLSEVYDTPTAVPANVEQYAEIIRERAMLRELLSASEKISRMCAERPGEIDDILDQAEKLIFRIKQERLKGTILSIRDILMEKYKEITALEEEEPVSSELMTQFRSLDELLGGLYASNFIIVAGRPSAGKSAFVMNLAENIAESRKVPVLIFSLEMSAEEVCLRMWGSRARVSPHRIRTKKLSQQEMVRLTQAASELSELPIYIDETPKLPLLELKAKARRMKSQRNIGLIIVDYLQLIEAPKAETRQLEVALVSRELKSLARELEIPVIAVSQLSRAAEQRGDPRPRLSDLRESGALEQDADVVLFIYKHPKAPEKKEKETDVIITTVEVAKHRTGPTGKINLAFLKSFVKFQNLAPEEEAEYGEQEAVEEGEE